jgi:hypothetical protein
MENTTQPKRCDLVDELLLEELHAEPAIFLFGDWVSEDFDCKVVDSG